MRFTALKEWSSALSDTRPLLECCKSCTARPNAHLIVTISGLEHHIQCLASSRLPIMANTDPSTFEDYFCDKQ